MMAAHNYHGEYAIWLLDHGADPNRTRTGFTALHLAAATKDLDLVKALLAHGAKVNVRLERGTPKSDEPAGKFSLLPEYMVGATPFLMASALNEIEIMKVLVAAGADPKINMVDGVTPLIAALGIDPGVLGLAPFRRGAPRDYFRAAPGDPPGSAPTRKKSGDEDPTLETVKYVIELGVDVNAARLNNVVYHGANPRTKFGRDAGDTALHTAAADKLPSVIEYLVSHGARMDLKNKRGLTPLGLAASDLRQYLNGYDGEKVGDPEIAALFRNLGAKE